MASGLQYFISHLLKNIVQILIITYIKKDRTTFYKNLIIKTKNIIKKFEKSSIFWYFKKYMSLDKKWRKKIIEKKSL